MPINQIIIQIYLQCYIFINITINPKYSFYEEQSHQVTKSSYLQCSHSRSGTKLEVLITYFIEY